MIDRGQVIKGLECLFVERKCDSINCPYKNADSCIDAVLSDALTLLKVEPKKAVRKQCKRQRYDGAVEYYAEWYCPHCDSLLKQGYGAPWVKYCFNCGKPVEWEGR